MKKIIYYVYIVFNFFGAGKNRPAICEQDYLNSGEYAEMYAISSKDGSGKKKLSKRTYSKGLHLTADPSYLQIQDKRRVKVVRQLINEDGEPCTIDMRKRKINVQKKR